MKVAKLIEKVGEYFDAEKKEQQKKVVELEKIIKELGEKRETVFKRMNAEENKKKKKEIKKEYKALVKLLHKARSKHCEIS